jgi:hypothetical protein
MSNELLEDFLRLCRTRYPVDGNDMSYSEWISTNTSDPRNPARRFSFEGYEFQRAIIDDLTRDKAVIKPSQVGLTEIQIRQAFAFLARNRGTSLIFSLPNDKMYERVSKTRIKPLIQREKVFNQVSTGVEKPTRTMGLYEIGNSFAYITGMTEGDATSIPADFLSHDELDLSDQAMIGLYQSRLQNSRWKLTHKFSTPTHPKYGIDAAYHVGDQKEYMLRCQCCGHWQVPLFNLKHVHLVGYDGPDDLLNMSVEVNERIDLDASYVKCERCHKQLDLLNPGLREWVSRHPGRRVSSYRVRPFATWSLNLRYLIEQQQKAMLIDAPGAISKFANTALGEPHTDGSNQLIDSVVRRVLGSPQRPEIGSQVPVAIGIDVGRVCHLTLGPLVGDQVHPVLMEIVPAEGDHGIVARVKELKERYNIVCGAMDRYPYTPTTNEVFAVSGGKIVPTAYHVGRLVDLVYDEFGQINYAKVNRTQVIDNVVRRIQREAYKIEGYGDMAEIVIQHLCGMVRIEIEEDQPRWEKLPHGADHFLHSLALMSISPRIMDVVRLKDQDQETRTQVGILQVMPRSASVGSDVLFGHGRHRVLG